MHYEAFRQARQFAFQDVKREIALAKASETENGMRVLLEAGVEPGGGNFMAALALLCYTEFAGKLKFNRSPSENFNRFFDELGPSYEAFRSVHPGVYGTFRCGLAHEFYVKKSCTICMCRAGVHPGIGQKSDGGYYFVVERYCLDLERAFTALEAFLFPEAVETVTTEGHGSQRGQLP